MQIDGRVIAGLAQQRDHALAFAEAIGADDVGSLGKQRHGASSFATSAVAIAMAEDGQPEGRFGDEEVAGDRLERGRVGSRRALIIAGDDGAAAAPFDHHLRAAEHMPGRLEPYFHFTDLQPLAKGESLGAGPRGSTEPRLHDGDGLACCQHMLMPRPGVIRMRMRDDCALHGSAWVDVKIPRPAIKPACIGAEPGLEAFRFHRRSV